MKKILAALVLSAVLVPVFAAADTEYGIEPTLGQLLSRLAAVTAIDSGKSINCAVAATKTTVSVGEVFTIAWGSYGATGVSADPKNAWAENGQQAIVMHTPQTRRYEFVFYGQNGIKATCYQSITVLAR